MQDRYTGDIGDYGKLGMLRCLAAAGLRVGVNWYRTPDEDHNEDGKFIQYVQASGQTSYRPYDPPLWDALAQIVNSGQRRVESLETPDILDAVFYNEPLDFRKVSFLEREGKRADWHRRALAALNGCELVFVDPDNGLMGAIGPAKQKSQQICAAGGIVRLLSAGGQRHLLSAQSPPPGQFLHGPAQQTVAGRADTRREGAGAEIHPHLPAVLLVPAASRACGNRVSLRGFHVSWPMGQLFQTALIVF